MSNNAEPHFFCRGGINHAVQGRVPFTSTLLKLPRIECLCILNQISKLTPGTITSKTMTSIYTLISSFGGQHQSASFFPSGSGDSCGGYATSLKQVEEEPIYQEDDDKYENNLNATLKRFVPRKGACHHCRRTDKLCYEYTVNSAYRMCEKCHGKLCTMDKNMWKPAGTPWEDEVPSYPLSREEGSPIRDEISHLQYLLTRLGFMPLSASDSTSGSFQRSTERAVAKFRREHNINGGDMSIYNKNMAEKLGEIVSDLRSNGHQYL